MREITCRCERSFDAELPDEIDLDAEPGRLAQVLAGEFFALSCPNCGERIKPEIRVRFRSRKRGLDFLVLPEMERLALYLGKAELPKGGEVLVGYAELFERARILEDGLDIESIEIAKYWLRVQAEEKASEGAAIGVAYSGLDEAGRLRFHVSGLRSDPAELAVLPLPREQYERILRDKSRTARTEPFDRIFAGPYRSVRCLEIPAED